MAAANVSVSLPQGGAYLSLGNDVVILAAIATTPTDGTSGTGVGIAGPGSLVTDYTNALMYINTGTKASPLWTLVGLQTT